VDPVRRAGDVATQRRLAHRRILAALRRLHRREPLRADLRVDAVIAEVRADHAERLPTGHRGGGHLALDDAALLDVIGEMRADGTVAGEGRRIRLPEHEPTLDPERRERVDALLEGLRSAGAAPPRIEGLAARLGIPPTVLDQLRAAGELVSIGPGIDYPRDRYLALAGRLDAMARGGRVSVARARDELRTSRRHAEALIAFRIEERRRHRA
jgi:hypothetical protein